MNASARALVWPAAFTVLVGALLLSLGFWQLRRLDEKEALIARIESRVGATPVAPPPPVAWAGLATLDYDYRHIRARGRFRSGADALVYDRAPEGLGPEPGYYVFTPFDLAGGGVVMVDRGFLPQSRADDPAWRAPPESETTIVGLMRAPQSRNMFTPADDPARGRWYTRDPAAMAAALGVAGAAPFSVALDADAAPQGAGPRPAPGKPNFPNNHLSYAVTWFGLALALSVICTLYARSVFLRTRAG